MIKPTADDYKAAPANVREVGEIAAQFKLTAMFEFVRQSTFASTLPTISRSPARQGTPTSGRCSTSITSGPGTISSKTWT
jgi:hypothetical protein